MDSESIKRALTDILKDVAQKAREDASRGKPDISSIFTDEEQGFESQILLDTAKVTQAIKDIEKATSTKRGVAALINGLVVLAKIVAKRV